MKISYGNSRTETHWKNPGISLEDFNARVSTTVRTTETVEEYRKMTKDQQASFKDKGGFVAGHLKKARRKKGHVLCRPLLALDIDFGTPDVWDTVLMKQSYKCCAYLTHKHKPKKPRLRVMIPLSREVSEAEYPAATSKKRRKKPNYKGSGDFTGKIKCASFGCNFRRCIQPASNSKEEIRHYWRCAEHGSGCKISGMRKDVLKKLTAEVMCTKEYNSTLFNEQINHIDVTGKDQLALYYKDGSSRKGQYVSLVRKALPRSKESKERMKQYMKARWTLEYRKQMSKKFKKIRRKKYWNSKRK